MKEIEKPYVLEEQMEICTNTLKECGIRYRVFSKDDKEKIVALYPTIVAENDLKVVFSPYEISSVYIDEEGNAIETCSTVDGETSFRICGEEDMPTSAVGFTCYNNSKESSLAFDKWVITSNEDQTKEYEYRCDRYGYDKERTLFIKFTTNTQNQVTEFSLAITDEEENRSFDIWRNGKMGFWHLDGIDGKELSIKKGLRVMNEFLIDSDNKIVNAVNDMVLYAAEVLKHGTLGTFPSSNLKKLELESANFVRHYNQEVIVSYSQNQIRKNIIDYMLSMGSREFKQFSSRIHMPKLKRRTENGK